MRYKLPLWRNLSFAGIKFWQKIFLFQ
jgi:hypothetical protein